MTGTKDSPRRGLCRDGGRTWAGHQQRRSEVMQAYDRGSNLIVAAPDIDRDLFGQPALSAISPPPRGRIRRLTLDSFSNDRALRASHKIRGKWAKPRTGEGSGTEIFIMPGVDSIDASAIRTDLLGHGYFAASGPLLTDLHLLVERCLPPSRRNLRKREQKTGYTYYSFA